MKKKVWTQTLGIGAINLAKLEDSLSELGERVLDVGCGAGFVVGNLEAECKVGLDLFKRGAVKAYAGVSLIEGDAQHLPLRDNSFDSVLCLDVLEHVDDPQLVVREIRRVLKDGGTAYFTTPVSGVNFLPGAEEYTRLLHKAWGHRRLYSREEFILLLEKEGLRSVKLEDYMHLTSRVFLYFYYAATALAGRGDCSLVNASEKLLYLASKLDLKIKFWSAFNTMAEAKK